MSARQGSSVDLRRQPSGGPVICEATSKLPFNFGPQFPFAGSHALGNNKRHFEKGFEIQTSLQLVDDVVDHKSGRVVLVKLGLTAILGLIVAS